MIRFANETDFENLAQVYQKIAVAEKVPAVFNWNFENALTELRLAKTLVYELSEQPVSFISYRELVDALEITALGTAPNFRRCGYLEALLAKLSAIAAQQDKPIWLEVHELNRAALALYQKWGFVLVQNRKKYYPDGASALVMTREKVPSQSICKLPLG